MNTAVWTRKSVSFADHRRMGHAAIALSRSTNMVAVLINVFTAALHQLAPVALARIGSMKNSLPNNSLKRAGCYAAAP